MTLITFPKPTANILLCSSCNGLVSIHKFTTIIASITLRIYIYFSFVDSDPDELATLKKQEFLADRHHAAFYKIPDSKLSKRYSREEEKKTRHHAVRKYVLHSMSMSFFNVLHLLRVCLCWNFYYWLMSQTIFQAFYLDGISASFQLSLGIVFPFSGWCVLQSFDINFCDSLAECNVIFSPATSWKINYYAIWYSVFYLFFLRRGGKKSSLNRRSAVLRMAVGRDKEKRTARGAIFRWSVDCYASSHPASVIFGSDSWSFHRASQSWH